MEIVLPGRIGQLAQHYLVYCELDNVSHRSRDVYTRNLSTWLRWRIARQLPGNEISPSKSCVTILSRTTTSHTQTTATDRPKNIDTAGAGNTSSHLACTEWILVIPQPAYQAHQTPDGYFRDRLVPPPKLLHTPRLRAGPNRHARERAMFT